MLSKKSFFLRLGIGRLLLAALFVLVASRLWYLQIVEGARYRQAAEVNRRRTLPIPPLRGRIFDRTGRVLADNIPSFSVLAMAEDLPEGPERARMLDRLCVLLGCSGSLQVNPQTLSEEARRTLYDWLAGRVGRPRAEVEAAATPFSLTLHLNEKEALWLREFISGTAGLTYTNRLEEALRKNAGPPYLPVLLMADIPRDQALVLEEHRQDLPGVFVQAEPRRIYPTGALTAHVVGYIGRIGPEELAALNPDPRSGLPQRYLESDSLGKVGAERAYEDILRGKLGFREIQVDASGHPVGAPFREEPAQPGYDIVLTLDTELQEKVTEILQSYIDQANRNRPSYYRPIYSGAAIAMDPRNGQILAMVSLPAYDNNVFVGGGEAGALPALLADPHHPLVNRAIGGEFPPGSTFKLVVASAALQEKVITPKTRIYDPGYLLVPNRYDPTLPPQVFPCWLRSGHGWQDVVAGIQHSCNVFFFTVAGGTPENKYQDGLGVERLVRYAQAFGYGEASGLGFPGEASGLLPTPQWKEEVLGEPWVQGDVYNMAIGQGNVLATPLQVLNAAAAIANGGTLYRPQLLLRVLDERGQAVREFQPEVIRRVPVDPEYLELVRRGMRAAVTESYNAYARNAVVPIAGKTGSAEFGPFLRQNIRQAHAWYVAFAPYEDPQLAVVVMIEGGGEGSRVALPAVVDIINAYFSR
ncbi:MAG: penicillin-binding protein 2 [Chloroflexia bacterium]